MISVVSHTSGNEADVGYAVRPVTPWADGVVVVDTRSDDATAEAARLGARVVLRERLGCADPARPFGLAPGGRPIVPVPNAHPLHRVTAVWVGPLAAREQLNERDRSLGPPPRLRLEEAGR